MASGLGLNLKPWRGGYPGRHQVRKVQSGPGIAYFACLNTSIFKSAIAFATLLLNYTFGHTEFRRFGNVQVCALR